LRFLKGEKENVCFLFDISRWFSDFVQIKNVQTNEKKCFSVHQWVDEITGRTQFSVTDYQQIPCDQ